MAKVIKKSTAPIYLVGIVWLVYALVFPLYRVTDYVLCALLSAVAFAVGKAIWPNATLIVEMLGMILGRLEIFIVLLMAGHLGGIIGMLVAIPAYTVIRVVAARFFSDFKPIRRLISATDDEQKS